MYLGIKLFFTINLSLGCVLYRLFIYVIILTNILFFFKCLLYCDFIFAVNCFIKKKKLNKQKKKKPIT